MSLQVLSRKESEERYRKTFAELHEKTVFTYQDEAGVHLCIVKNRLEEEALQVVKISAPETIDALCTGTGQINPYVYEFNLNHCLNILKLANREPLIHEIQRTKEKNSLETYYDANKEAIWSRQPSRDSSDYVMLYHVGDTLHATYFNMSVLGSWPERPGGMCIYKNRSE